MFNYTDKDGDINGVRIGVHIFIALVVIVTLFSSFGTVSAGQVGVKTEFGKVVGEVQPGFYAVIPFIQGVTIMNTQTQKDEVDNASAASNDLQTVNTNVAVNFNINPSQVGLIYQNIGTDYQSLVIDPAIQESLKSVTANYTAEQLITEREQVRQDILNLLVQKLAPDDIQVTALSITDFKFSDQFNAAIEAKVTAQQDALASQNKYQQTIYDASSTVEAAKAQAEAIQIQAEAINSQGGADYVSLQAIKQWDGHLPTQMIPGETLPFINTNLTK